MQNDIYIDTALRIIHRLSLQAIWQGKACYWLNATTDLQNHQKTSYGIMSGDFYAGTSGMAWLYLKAYEITGDNYYKKFAEGALYHAIEKLEHLNFAKENFFSGKFGIAYVSMYAGKIFKNDIFLQYGIKIIAEIENTDNSRLGLDIINGPAGSVYKLLQIEKQFDIKCTSLLTRWFEHYLKTKLTYQNYVVWNTMNESVAPMTGYAHGMSGIAGALLDIYQAIGEEECKTMAISAMNYENSCFQTTENNWPDFRHLDTSTPYQLTCAMAWCHGAPGIGLQRLRAWKITGDERWLKDATMAAESTYKISKRNIEIHNGNFSLCHGIFGNNELLLEYDAYTNTSTYTNTVKQMATIATEEIEKKGLTWPCGLHNSDESVGFMLGIAGIAYHYLRLYSTEKVENILA